jgi:hypothetical protein
MTHYGIIGSGKCGENIIEDGLSELGIENNIFLICPRKGATSSEDRVYDFMLDNEAEYIAYTKSNAPQVLVDNASKVFDCTGGDSWLEILNTLKSKKGTLLVLWDAENEENISNFIFDAHDMGIPVKELSNGLVPINVDASATDTSEKQTPDIVEIEPFSDDELRSMSIGVLRKAATARGVSDVGAYSKEELVEQLVDKKTHKEKIEEPEMATTTGINPTATTSYKVTSTSEERPQLVAPDGDCMVTVVMPNGTVISTPATMEEVRVLLGLSGGS